MTDKKKRKSTSNLNSVRENVLEIADSVRDIYWNTNDIRAANIAIKSYNTAIHATLIEIQYKRACGQLKDIVFISKNK